jgi:flagellar basal body rod protein FlgF
LTADRSIDLSLESTGDIRGVAIKDAANFLYELQLLINHLGDYLTGSDYRKGPSPESVSKRCELFIKEIETGSVKATLQLQDKQLALEGATLGESSIDKFHEIMDIIANGKEIENNLKRSIDHNLHRTKIIEDLHKLWPNEKDNYLVRIFYSNKEIKLESDTKLLVEGLLHRNETQKTSVKGILGELKVMQNKRMRIIGGPDGNIGCTFSKEKMDQVKKLIGKPVTVFGDADFDSYGSIKEMTDIEKLERFTEFKLHRILSEEKEITLSYPIIVDVDYSDDQWILKNDELNIMGFGETYDESLKEFNEEFVFVWKEYGLANDNDLTYDAQLLKKNLMHHLESRKEI